MKANKINGNRKKNSIFQNIPIIQKRRV